MSKAEAMRAACIQMCSGEDVEQNLASAATLLAQARSDGCMLAVLPENFSFMAADEKARRRAADRPDRSRALRFLAEQAKSHGMYIIGGTVPLLCDEPPGMRSCSAVFGPDGGEIACYDKIHLFDVSIPGDTHTESASMAPGKAPQMAEIGGWKAGLSVCYDLRFPELYRHYSAHGCQLLSVVAAFTVPTGKAHWEALLRSRAIENQSYVLAAAQAGEHPGGRKTWGHSMIIDPWGGVLAERDEGAGLVVAELDPARVGQVRDMIPALRHRRI